MKKLIHLRKLTLFIVFCALGVALSPFASFVVFGTSANPTQHMINAIVGVLLGPFWAVGTALTIGVMRNMLGIGTLYAFPGGLFGGLVVGASYWLFKKIKLNEHMRIASALTEPIGTLLIGLPLSLYLFAPLIGTPILMGLIREGPLVAISVFGAGWMLSCVPGCIIGFLVLLALNKVGINREKMFGDTKEDLLLDSHCVIGKKLLVLGDVNTGKTELAAKLLSKLLLIAHPRDVTVIDFAPQRRNEIGGKIRNYLQLDAKVRYLTPETVYTPRLTGKTPREILHLAKLNKEVMEPLLNGFIGCKTKTLVINDVTLFFHAGELAKVMRCIHFSDTVVITAYYGSRLANDLGAGISSREKEMVDSLLFFMDLSVRT